MKVWGPRDCSPPETHTQASPAQPQPPVPAGFPQQPRQQFLLQVSRPVMSASPRETSLPHLPGGSEESVGTSSSVFLAVKKDLSPLSSGHQG